MSTTIYRAPKYTQPTSNLLNLGLLIDISQKYPKDAKVCIYHDYEGDGGEYYVKYIEYDSAKNRVIIHACAEPDANNANQVDRGAPWFGGSGYDTESDNEE